MKKFVLLITILLASHGTARALERDVVVGIYQGPCVGGEFTQNLQTARTVIDQAKHCHFLAFPETFLSGYDTRAEMERGARSLEDPELQQFIAESAQRQTVILIGLARRTPMGIYNSVLVIHRGTLLGIYDKIMLTGGDRDHLKFLPGKAMPVFQAHGAKFAVIICHDSSFPQPALLAKLKGAEMLFSPHYNSIQEPVMDDHRRWVRNCHRGLACQMKMVVARANIVQVSPPRTPGAPSSLGYGDSFILSPQGELLAETLLFRRELVTATITPKMFQPPTVWANLDETPAWLNAELGDLLHHRAAPKNTSPARQTKETPQPTAPASNNLATPQQVKPLQPFKAAKPSQTPKQFKQ